MKTQPPAQPYDWTFRRVMGATLVLFFIALGFWLIYRFYQVAFILFISIVMGTVIRSVINWLQHRGIPRLAGIILVYILLLALLVGFVFLLYPLIIEQGTKMADIFPVYYLDLRQWLVSSPNLLFARLGSFLPWSLSGAQPVQQTGEQVLASAEQALGYIALVANAIFISTTVLVLTYRWALDGPRMKKSLLTLVSKNKREGIQELFTAMESKVSFYIAGQGVLCLMIGFISLISYMLIGLPNALLLAILAGVLEAVPIVGPLLGAIPAAAVALSIAPSKLIWVIVSAVVIQQLENSFLVPRVMRKAVGVNPFVSLLAIFAFSSIFGIAGALMAIPMAAIIQILLNRFVFQPEETDLINSNKRDQASLLRYQTQDLAQDLRKQARLVKRGSDQMIKQIDKTMDEIESIATDLDVLLSQVHSSDIQ